MLLWAAVVSGTFVAAQDTSREPAETVSVATRELTPFVIPAEGGYTGFSADLWAELGFSRIG
jgi:hypothetical protein